MSALQILNFTGDSFRINTENFISVLRKVGHRPVAILSINGATRTGKSYALNYFIQYLESGCPDNDSWYTGDAPIPNKFVYRNGKERTTVGINLWSEPYFVQQNGREIAVLLLDTQGLFDEQTNSRQNAIIYSLSALCSSVSIFNLMKNLDENVLQQINFFSSYAHLVTANGDKATRQESFQKLVFLIRDFDFLEYEYGHHDMKSTDPVSPQNFCRDVFLPSKENTPLENIFVREKILASYQNVSISLLPYPGKNLLKSGIPSDDEFRPTMMSFVRRHLSKGSIVVKRIGEQEMTGEQFEVFIEAWAKLCDKADDHFPAVQSILESSAIIQNNLALNTAKSFHEREMESFFASHSSGLPDGQFLVFIEQLQVKGLAVFDKIKKLGRKETEDEYREKLLKEFKISFESNRKFNQLLQAKAAMEQQVKEHQENIQRLNEEMAKAENQNQQAQAEFRQQIQKAEEKMREVERKNLQVQSELQSKIDESEKRVTEMSKRSDKYREELDRERENTKQLVAQQEQRMTEARNLQAVLQTEIANSRQQMTEISRTSDENARKLAQAYENQNRIMAENQAQMARMHQEHAQQTANLISQLNDRDSGPCVLM